MNINARHTGPQYLVRALFGALGLTLASCIPASAQTQLPPRVNKSVNMSGPRFGLTMLNQESIDTLKDKADVTVRPLVSQFGWQFERRFYTNGEGVTLLNEWIPLVSGLDQGVALPSLNWLVGVRSASGSRSSEWRRARSWGPPRSRAGAGGAGGRST